MPRPRRYGKGLKNAFEVGGVKTAKAEFGPNEHGIATFLSLSIKFSLGGRFTVKMVFLGCSTIAPRLISQHGPR